MFRPKVFYLFIYNNMSYHLYFICNKDKEESRYNFIHSQIINLDLDNYKIVSYYWADDITHEFRKQWVKSDTAMRTHGRTMLEKPLNNGEISLFMNHISCLKEIRETFTEGIFIIFESDVIFNKEYMIYIGELINKLSKQNNWDIVNIGEGACNQLPVNRIDGKLDIYKESINRCTEGIIWNYRSICKFLELFAETNDIDSPIDTKMDYYSEHMGCFNIFWSHPPLISQGSVKGKFKSHLR